MSSSRHVALIASPLADSKGTRALLRVTKKCAKENTVRRGIKEVVKTIRKGQPGSCFVLIAGDISPIDVISHLPVLCEIQGIPYIFVPSKEKLGHSSKTKRSTSCVLVERPKNNKDVAAKYDEVVAGILKK